MTSATGVGVPTRSSDCVSVMLPPSMCGVLRENREMKEYRRGFSPAACRAADGCNQLPLCGNCARPWVVCLTRAREFGCLGVFVRAFSPFAHLWWYTEISFPGRLSQAHGADGEGLAQRKGCLRVCLRTSILVSTNTVSIMKTDFAWRWRAMTILVSDRILEVVLRVKFHRDTEPLRSFLARG